MDDLLLEYYTDYLACSKRQASATLLADVLGGEFSHDQITRWLSDALLPPSKLYDYSTKLRAQIEEEDAMLAIDDTLIHKPYSQESGIVAYYFDHTKNKTVKAINVVDVTYCTSKFSIPHTFGVIEKDKFFYYPEDGKWRRPQLQTKHEVLQSVVSEAIERNLKFKYVGTDIWFASADNMRFIKMDCDKEFICPIKSNRHFKMNGSEKEVFKPIKDIEMEIGKTYRGRLRGVPFDVQVVKLVFIHENSVATMFLCTSDLSLSAEQIKSGYKKRWRVEDQHKDTKQLSSLAKCPASSVSSQKNHIFCSYLALIKLDEIRITADLTRTSTQRILEVEGIRASLGALNRLRQNLELCHVYSA